MSKRLSRAAKAAPHATRTAWWPLFVLAALALLAYSNSFRAGLALDARPIIQDDPRIREVTAPNLGLMIAKDYWWPNSRDRLYRPATTASFLLNYAILGSGD